MLRLAELVTSSEDPDSDYPQHCPAIIEVTSLGKVHRRHVRFHPGSPEAALSRDDVLDKFARNSHWLFGKNAREIGALADENRENFARCAATPGRVGRVATCRNSGLSAGCATGRERAGTASGLSPQARREMGGIGRANGLRTIVNAARPVQSLSIVWPRSAREG